MVSEPPTSTAARVEFMKTPYTVDQLFEIVRSWAIQHGYTVRIFPYETPCGIHWAGKLLDVSGPLWFGFARKAETLLLALCLDWDVEVVG